MRKWILATVTVMLIPGTLIFAKLHSGKHLASGVFHSESKSTLQLGNNILRILKASDTIGLENILPTTVEYVRLDKFLADSGQNPDAGRMIGMLMTSENFKAAGKWIAEAKRMKNYKNPSVTGPDSIESHQGVEIWRGMSLWAEDSLGHKVQIPLFRSLVKSGDGFIIYTLMDPSAKD